MTTAERGRERRDADAEARDSGLLFAAVDDDLTRPIVLGIGPTPDDARADAALWLGAANAVHLATAAIFAITETEAAVVRAGDRTWPIRLVSREERPASR